eukprot:3084093-Lingulodinium_polyedra.AAC.1
MRHDEPGLANDRRELGGDVRAIVRGELFRWRDRVPHDALAQLLLGAFHVVQAVEVLTGRDVAVLAI